MKKVKVFTKRKCTEATHRFKTLEKGMKWQCRKCGEVRPKVAKNG